MCSIGKEKYGSNPVDIQWDVVRGDTAKLRIDFLENDEVTYFDTSEWTYKATAYDPAGDVLDDLDVEHDNGYVVISISPEITKNWGSKYAKIVAELPFDLQAYLPENCEDTVWTPVIGTIRVLGDVSPGGSL